MSTTTRKPGATRRAEILAATRRILGRDGAPGLTTSALAAEVGLTSGALFRHFPSREAILDATAHEAVSALEVTFPDPDTPALERLGELARNRIELLGGDAGLRWLLGSEEALRVLSPVATAEVEAVVARSRDFLRTALEEARAGDEIRTDLPVDQLLVPVVGTIHAAIGLGGAHRKASERARIGAEAVETLLALLRPHEPIPATRRRRDRRPT